ncbi:holin [Burkholderia phage BcepSauron]|uniref:Holin n=2 Tax=Sarumanvirus TaxID=2843450 RepID=A0A482MLX8_9CAUD|nr:holin [Burkholderia phage BcepSaruman]YP_009904663.1 holin [Burkholderia phage BcepSauron]QBQ74665.1 holin [Burkholderia phage BcepSauron]QBX06697.1 putative type 1 holin [Burkholderia phage BcepSaruman]
MFQGDKDPFGYGLSTYAWVFGLAIFGGAVKYLNNGQDFRFVTLVRDLITAGFAGLMTFWACEWFNIDGPIAAILIATAGLMGTRAIALFESFYTKRLESLGFKVDDAAQSPATEGNKGE